MFHNNRKSHPIVMVACVCARQVWPETCTSIVNVIQNPFYGAFTVFHRGSSIVPARNKVAALFLEHAMKPTHLLFVDDDMIFGADAVEKLLLDHKDVVMGNCFTRKYPCTPAYGHFDKETKGKSAPFTAYEKNALQPVEYVGMALTLISRRALEAVGEKPFREIHYDETNIDMSEDISFCRRALDKGIVPWVDTRVQVGHIGEHVFDERDFEATQQILAEAAEA